MTDKREVVLDNYTAKQDGQGARTPAQLEQKYNFGKSFAEVLGVAEDARTTAEEAKQAVDDLDLNLDQDEVFNRLTNNGKSQGLFKAPNGDIYINAEYIAAIEKLFAKDILMTGKFSNTTKAFIYPGEPELETLRQHFLETVPIPEAFLHRYDFNSDGVVDGLDLLICQKARLGLYDLSTWEGAEQTDITLTIDLTSSEKAICITGKNMWGRNVESYIGANHTNIKNPDTERRISNLDEKFASFLTTEKILADRCVFLHQDQSVALSESIYAQHRGIVLEWCKYDSENDEATPFDVHYTFVPKSACGNYIQTGLMTSMEGNVAGTKVFQVLDDEGVTTINGLAPNAQGITQQSTGIITTNNYWVLHRVFGE